MPDTKKSVFSGMYVATLTPFNATDHVDYGILNAHLDSLSSSGISGVCPAGTTGEFLYLSTDEKVRVVAETVKAVNGRMQVIAGVWEPRAKDTALLARSAEDAGADGVFLPPPIYYPASDDAIYAWYSNVRNACNLPVFAYNIPAYAANSLSIECLEKLVADGVITGVKDSTGKVDRMSTLVERCGERSCVMAASDSFALEGRRLGAVSFISAIANIWPKAFIRLWAGDIALQPAVDVIRNSVKANGGIAALKYLATLSGFDYGAARLPYTVLSGYQKAALRQTYDEAVRAGLGDY